MTTVCLVRHNETDWNSEGRYQGREDIVLNANGKIQADCCANYLKQYEWDFIVTSPLKRAKETAYIISEKIGTIDVLGISDFTERDYGAASGLTVQERANKFPDGNIPGQEDWQHLKERSMNALINIVNKYEGMRIIIISHGGVINSILLVISNGEIGTGKTKLKNACMNTIHYIDGCCEIELYKETGS